MGRMKVLALAVLLSLPVVASAREAAQTHRITVGRDGEPANQRSYSCDVSAGGRAVAFDSAASNLVAGDTNGIPDVFVADEAGVIERVSVTPGGRESETFTGEPALSRDGRFVGFNSSTYDMRERGNGNGRSAVFVHDRRAGRTTRVSERSDGGAANGSSGGAALSANGRWVAFASSASNLAAKGDDNGTTDIFVHDRRTGKTNRVSLSRTGGDPNWDSSWHTISGNGRHVAYASYSSNVVRRDRNDAPDIFVYDRVERRTEIVSVTSEGRRSDEYSWGPNLSHDGRYVSFSTYAVLAETDTVGGKDVYVHDRATGETEQVSVDSEERPLNQETDWATMSEDGRYVAFATPADNPGSGDTNEAFDVYVRDRVAGTTTRVSVGDEGQEANDDVWPFGSISPDGRYVCWLTAATNLDDRADPGDYEDVFLRGPLWE